MSDTTGRNILIGSLIGGVVIGTSVALMYANKGKLNRDLKYRYKEVKNKMDEFFDGISLNTHSIAQDVNNQAAEWTEKAQDFVEWAQDQIECLNDPENKQIKYGLIAGAAVIGLLGATAAVVCSSKPCDKTSQDILEKISEKVCAWRKTMENILDLAEGGVCTVSDGLNRVNKSVRDFAVHSTKSAKAKTNTMQDIVDFAASGLQLWQSIKNKR